MVERWPDHSCQDPLHPQLSTCCPASSAEDIEVPQVERSLLLDLAQHAEQGWLHPVTVESVLPSPGFINVLIRHGEDLVQDHVDVRVLGSFRLSLPSHPILLVTPCSTSSIGVLHGEASSSPSIPIHTILHCSLLSGLF